MAEAEKRAFGRNLADFLDLNEAEQKLLDSCFRGEVCSLGKERPETPTPQNTIRAGFLRFLVLGGDAANPVHEHGVLLQGAWIKAPLDLRGATSAGDVYLTRCWFDEPPTLYDACIKGTLSLEGSRVKELAADRLSSEGDVFLRNGFKAEGNVRLLGAKIGGSLECDNASFTTGKGDSGDALNADRIEVNGGVFLRNGFKAEGDVSLLGAKIGGNLSCIKATICGSGAGLSLEGMAVAGKFFFRQNSPAIGNVLLSGARVGTLVDDEASWGEGLDLHNFTYDAISATSPSDGATRRAWLDKQQPELSGKDGEGKFFTPQPWLRLKKVLKEAGHNQQARQIGIALEERRRHCGKVGKDETLVRPWRDMHSGFVWVLHWLFGAFAGYGYRPFKLLYWSIGVWLLCATFYDIAAYRAAFAPSSAIILNDSKLLAACSPAPPDAPPNPRHNWYLCPALPSEYTGFHPLMYSLNVLLPVVDLQQEQAWGPITPTPSKVWWPNAYALFESWGGWAQLFIWGETLYGWMAGAMLIAVVTGLTRKQEEE